MLLFFSAKKSNQKKLPAWFRPVKVSGFAVPVPPVRSRGRFFSGFVEPVVIPVANQNPFNQINPLNPGSETAIGIAVESP
jgi:hypothetical protein